MHKFERWNLSCPSIHRDHFIRVLSWRDKFKQFSKEKKPQFFVKKNVIIDPPGKRLNGSHCQNGKFAASDSNYIDECIARASICIWTSLKYLK